MELVRYTGDSDWSALYVDGVLDIVGDHYLIDDRIAELAHVINHDSNDFLQGGNERADVAATLEDLAEYRKSQTEANAEQLRAKGAQLLKEAADLMAQANQLGQ